MTDTISPKLCINCRWVASPPYEKKIAEAYRCLAPQNKRGIDLVLGSVLYHHDYCSTARANDCGEEALWFEPKPLLLEPPKPQSVASSLLDQLK